MAGITIGPFSFPAGLVVAFTAIAIALAVGNALAGTVRERAERLLWTVLAVGVLAARGAFVVRYWSVYADRPLQALDIRDGGFHALAGIAAAIVVAAVFGWRHADVRKALLAATLAGSLAWAGGSALASLGAPDLRLSAAPLAQVAGGETSLRAFGGRPVVVNLWASWCPPCRREMPALAQAQRDHPDVTFVFVNQGESEHAVLRYLRAEGLALRHVLLDPGGRIGKETGSPGLPTTLFVGADGRLLDRRAGELSTATLAERLQALSPKGGGGGGSTAH